MSIQVLKPCVKHIGNRYPSISAMCNQYNIDHYVYNRRIEAGWMQEEALTRPYKPRPEYYTDHIGNKFKTIEDMCKQYGLFRTTYIMRLRSGWTQEEALTVPVNKYKYRERIGEEKSNGK